MIPPGVSKLLLLLLLPIRSQLFVVSLSASACVCVCVCVVSVFYTKPSTGESAFGYHLSGDAAFDPVGG